MHLAKCLQNRNYELISDDFKRNNQKFGIREEQIHEQLKNIGIKISRDDEEQRDVCITLWGSGKPFREFLYVDDLSSAALFLMENKSNFSIVNVGTGKDCSISDLAKIIANVVGFKGKISFDRTKPDGTMKKLLDVSRLISSGWQASVSLKSGIEASYTAYLKGG
jgi:GDP-L-fucose synthase